MRRYAIRPCAAVAKMTTLDVASEPSGPWKVGEPALPFSVRSDSSGL
jgi:hypothetical protein